jgi:hypothetical protein
MFSAAAVTIHGLDHALTALRPGMPVVLVSAPGAGLYGGCGWWGGLIGAARAAFPGDWRDLLDCADAPGQAMAALRAGCRGIVLDGECPAFSAVSGAAGLLGAFVLPHRPACLDLAEPGGTARLSDWLERDNDLRLR